MKSMKMLLKQKAMLEKILENYQPDEDMYEVEFCEDFDERYYQEKQAIVICGMYISPSYILRTLHPKRYESALTDYACEMFEADKMSDQSYKDYLEELENINKEIEEMS